MARFVVVNGAEAGSSFDLDAPEVVIGRQTGVEIKLNGTNVSRRHARVSRNGDSFLLEDLGSSNGTFLNGAKIAQRASLKPLDEVRIGPYLLRFETPAAQNLDVTIRARTVANPANQDLFRENAARKLQIILQLSADLSRTLELDLLLPEILKHLFSLFPNAERGLMIFVEGNNAVVRAARNRDGSPAGTQFSHSIFQKVLAEKVALLAEDVQSDTRFAEAQSICSLGVRSLMGVPLQSKTGKVFGILQLERMGAGNRFTTEDMHFLAAIALQVSVALENAQLHQELIHKHRIEREIAVAREIQLGYLPRCVPDFPARNFELHAELSPAYEISGDFYDYFKLDEHQLAIAVADVSGKGVPAALFMNMVRAHLRNLAQPSRSAGEILREVNDALARENPNCLFVTMALAIFDTRSCHVQLSCGGHPPALLRPATGGVKTLSHPQGPLLGFDLLSAPLPEFNMELARGDTLLLYTDGLTEAPSRDLEMFGSERLQRALEAWTAADDLCSCASAIRSSVAAFTQPAPQEDDITLALLRRS